MHNLLLDIDVHGRTVACYRDEWPWGHRPGDPVALGSEDFGRVRESE